MIAKDQYEPLTADELFSDIFELLFPDIPYEDPGDISEEDLTDDGVDDCAEVMLFRGVPEVHKIYFNNRHTTIEWADGEKTTVGCAAGQEFDEYSGFGAAVLKRLFGSSRGAIRYMNEHKVVQPLPEKYQKKVKQNAQARQH